jgi:hypothetical protein
MCFTDRKKLKSFFKGYDQQSPSRFYGMANFKKMLSHKWADRLGVEPAFAAKG